MHRSPHGLWPPPLYSARPSRPLASGSIDIYARRHGKMPARMNAWISRWNAYAYTDGWTDGRMDRCVWCSGRSKDGGCLKRRRMDLFYERWSQMALTAATRMDVATVGCIADGWM